MKRPIAILVVGGTTAWIAAASQSLPNQALHPTGVPGVGQLGGPSRPLSTSEMEQFVRGRDLFDKNFHRTEGLGFPDFNADSCRACHSDPVMGGAGPLEVNVFRAGRDNGGAGPFENIAGGQVFSKLRSPWFDDRGNTTPRSPTCSSNATRRRSSGPA
jgi:hypothetical protein